MAVFKKNLTPLTKGGTITKHAGKGSQAGQMPSGQSFGNYAKQTPMANPTPDATVTGGGTDGLGSGNWPGVGG